MKLREGSETYSQKRFRDLHAIGSFQVATPSSIHPRCCQCVSHAAHSVRRKARGAERKAKKGVNGKW